MPIETPSPTDAFGLREQELLGSSPALTVGRMEVRAAPGTGLDPLLEALHSAHDRVAWLASQITVPPLLALFQALDPDKPLKVDLVAPFAEDCFAGPLARRLTFELERWSSSWRLRTLEGPTYPGHVFVFDQRVLLCREPLLEPDPLALEWVVADLDSLPSLVRRLRRRQAACRVLPPNREGNPPRGVLPLPELPSPRSAEERRRRERLERALAEGDSTPTIRESEAPPEKVPSEGARSVERRRHRMVPPRAKGSLGIQDDR